MAQVFMMRSRLLKKGKNLRLLYYSAKMEQLRWDRTFLTVTSLLKPGEARMPASRIVRPIIFTALVLIMNIGQSKADYFLFSGGFQGFGAYRFDDQGTVVKSYGAGAGDISESYDHWVLAPDQDVFYVFDNNLGSSSILPYDVATREALVSHFDTEFSTSQPNNIFQGHHGLVQGSNLYVISNNVSPVQATSGSVKVFDTASGDYQGVIALAQTAPLLDQAINTQFHFLLTGDGIYNASTLTKVSNHVAGDRGIALSSDNQIYVTNGTTDEIRRYNSDGAFVDVFLSAADLGMIPQSTQFGPNGDLYVLGVIEVLNDLDIPVIKRFDIDTSEFISETQFDSYYTAIGWISDGISGFNDRFYILVPEPGSIAMLGLMLAGLATTQPRGCQLH
jgi:hypothetical protein